MTKSKLLSSIGLCILLIGTGFISNKAFEIYFTRKNQSIELDKIREKEATFQKEKDDLVAKLNAKDAELVKMKEDIKKTKVDAEMSNIKDYEKRFLEAYYSILFNSQSSSSIIDLISEIWDTAIKFPDYYYYGSFNIAIREVSDTLKQRGIIEQFQKTHSDIESKVSSLKIYPIKYKEAYDALLDLYLIYSQIYDLSLHPTGSLLSFNNKVHDLESEYTKSLSKLKLYLPQTEEGLEDIEHISQITKEYNKIKEECEKIDKEEGNKMSQAIQERFKKEEEGYKKAIEYMRGLK